MDKSKKFKAALALAGITHRKFAEQVGVHPQFLYYVVRGKLTSQRVEKAVDTFIDEQFSRLGENQHHEDIAA